MQLILIVLAWIVHLSKSQRGQLGPVPGQDKLRFGETNFKVRDQNELTGNEIPVAVPFNGGAPGNNIAPNVPNLNDAIRNVGRVAETAKKIAGIPGQAGLKERLSSSPQCSEDYLKICSDVSRMNNFAVLECLQNSNKDTRLRLSPECNHHLWLYKNNVTQDRRFKEAAATVCRKELDKCPDIKAGAELLSCLIENSDDIQNTHCRQFVGRMEVVVFSDFRLMRDFYDKCSESVSKTGCGVVSGNSEQDDGEGHSQGATIHCLEKNLRTVDKSCRGALLRVAELSADDYTKDRALYFACREDRERFCEKEVAGNGRIYKCLMDHKKDKHMSDPCFEALSVRQKMVAKDVKIDKSLVKNCKHEIKESHCLSRPDASLEVTLSSLILCLEESDVQLSGECESELFDIRRSLMEDYKVNAEIVANCKTEISQNCDGLRREGKTLHCLMQKGMKQTLSKECKTAVRDLLREVKAGSDYRLDPYLAEVCQKSISALCSNLKAGKAKVISCLLDNVDSNLMEEKCATNLYELQYFISRDFKLDPNLAHSCKADVNAFCDGMDAPDRSSELFSCLHKHLHNGDEGLSPECATQMHRALRQRASDVSLNPTVEQNCRKDLGRFCDVNKEFDCLQTHFAELETQCKNVMQPFITEESEDIRMNKALMKACSPMLKKYCKAELKRKVDEGEALDCLISHKSDPEMDARCTAGIEHFQIVLLTDYTLTFKFKQACRDDVDEYCQKSGKSKEAVLSCLSEKIRNQILKGEPPLISEGCRAQVKFEVLQQSEDIKLDPSLYKACKDDLNSLCPSHSTSTTDAALECLRKNDGKISEKCYQKVFDKQKELEEKPDWDYHLMQTCKRYIKMYCESTDDEMLDCLYGHIKEGHLDQACRETVLVRMMERSRNSRLNPTLKRVCYLDMGRLCPAIREEAREDRKMDLQGAMISCLQDHMYAKKEPLSPQCAKYIRHFTMETALNYELDPQLKNACGDIAKKKCHKVLIPPGGGLVVECLKDLVETKELTDPKCRKQILKLMSEGVADIHVDPPLAAACALDLTHYCNGVPQGQGQQMACLLEALEDSSVTLQANCEKMLKDRKELWEYAAEVAPPETLGELYLQIHHSPSRNHFFVSIVSFIAGVLFFGICCGRATRSVPQMVKNK